MLMAVAWVRESERESFDSDNMMRLNVQGKERQLRTGNYLRLARISFAALKEAYDPAVNHCLLIK
jgi:hypothetical protein